MAAKRLAFAFCALGFLQTSFAGFERFWIFSKDADTQVTETWETLSDAEQRALIQRYQSLKELPEAEKKQLINLAINYPPSTRALSGAIWEQLGYADYASILLKTLKSTTWYYFNIPQEILPNKEKWKIK